MSRRRTTRRRRSSSVSSARPLVAFLLIASFGILFAGCDGSRRDREQAALEDFTFTADDVARFQELKDLAEQESGLGNQEPFLALDDSTESLDNTEVPVLDLSLSRTYDAIRSGFEESGDNEYKVTNEFLNVRDAPNVTANAVERLDKGDVLVVVDFPNAAWAHIKLPGGREGFVAQRYIGKITSEAKLAQEKEKFKDYFFVDFGFLNVRRESDVNAEKIGELPGQSFVTVLSKDETWARIPFESGEGYVAAEYLTPFLPNFLIRQEEYKLPILHYRLVQDGMLDAMTQHIAALQQAGYKFMTFEGFRGLLLQQEDRDVRLEPKRVIIAVSSITKENMKGASDVLRASNVPATLFLETGQIGIDGITEKDILTLLANGHDLQTAAHTGDDLRSLTNAQVELELAQSRQILEEYTNGDIFAIAYPLGGVNDRIAGKARESGYLLGLGARQAVMFNRREFLNLPNLGVSASSSAEEILQLINDEQ